MKLSEIQLKLKVPKKNRNDFGKYNYRSAEDILEAVKVIINPVGLSIIVTDEIVMIGDRYYVKATATIIDNEGIVIGTSQAYAREEETIKGMAGAQITGASSSYSKKYALNGLLAIDDTKDADALEPQETPLETAIGNVRLCMTIEDLTTLKSSLPESIVKDKKFTTAAMARYNQLTKTQ